MSRARSPAHPVPDWGPLQTFLAVAEAGTIQAAAQRLGVNHSTVLRRIAALEAQWGCRLFDRLPGGYAPTAAGNLLAEQLAGLTEQLEGAERQVRGLDPALRGTVRLTSSDIVVEALLMPQLARFRRAHAGVQLQLVTDYRFAALGRSEADIAVRGADRAPPRLVAERVGQIESVPCAARSLLAAPGGATAPERQGWVVVDSAAGFGGFERWFRARVPAGRIVARVDSLVALADAVAQGLGVGFLPRPLVAARPELVELGPPEPALRKPVWVLMHPDVQGTARVRALFDALVAGLRADPDLQH